MLRFALGALATCYSLAWDTLKDFGLAHGLVARTRERCARLRLRLRRAACSHNEPLPPAAKHGHWFLRSRMSLRPNTYYAIAAANCCLRLLWIAPLVMGLPHERAALEGLATVQDLFPASGRAVGALKGPIAFVNDAILQPQLA